MQAFSTRNLNLATKPSVSIARLRWHWHRQMAYRTFEDLYDSIHADFLFDFKENRFSETAFISSRYGQQT